MDDIIIYSWIRYSNKPWCSGDKNLIITLSNKVKKVVVIEENSLIGGLNSAICELLAGKNIQILNIGLPDSFIEHGYPEVLRDKYGLTAEKIASKIYEWIKKQK